MVSQLHTHDGGLLGAQELISEGGCITPTTRTKKDWKFDLGSPTGDLLLETDMALLLGTN